MTGRAMFRGALIVACLLTVSSAAQAQGRRGGGMMGQGFSPYAILRFEAVQKELGLTPEQTDKVKDLNNDVREEFTEQSRGAGIEFGRQNDLSKEEQAKRMAERRTKLAEITKHVNEKFRPKFEEVLDKKQQARLNELALQAAGAAALDEADVAKALGITKEQQEKIKALNNEFSQKLRAAFTGGGDLGRFGEMRKEHTEKVVAVLTKEQQDKFTKMKGKEFDVSALRPRGPRGNRDTKK